MPGRKAYSSPLVCMDSSPSLRMETSPFTNLMPSFRLCKKGQREAALVDMVNNGVWGTSAANMSPHLQHG